MPSPEPIVALSGAAPRTPEPPLRWSLRVDVIEEQRILNGMTRRALAQAVRTDPKTLGDAINGRRTPNLTTLLCIVTALGLEIREAVRFEHPAR